MEKQINNLRDELAEQPMITSVAPLPFYVKDTHTVDIPKPAKPLPMGVADEGTTLWQSLTNVYNYTKIGIVLMPTLVKLIYGLIVKNWKTTIGALIAGLATVLNALGIVDIPAEVQTGIMAVALFIIGLFARDASNKDATEN